MDLSTTLIMLRRITSHWLRTLARLIDIIAEHRKDDASEDEEELQTEALGRSRNDTFLSVDSGIVDDCDFSCETDHDTGLEVINLEEVSYHCTKEDGWMVIYNRVYDMTEYLDGRSHPGGEDVMVEYLGYDATMAFRGVGHSREATDVLAKYCIGILPEDERIRIYSDYYYQNVY